MREHQQPVLLPCPPISELIGELIDTDLRNPSSEVLAQLSALESLYAKECGPSRPKGGALTGVRATVRLTSERRFSSVFAERGNEVTVLAGGNDGELITIDSSEGG